MLPCCRPQRPRRCRPSFCTGRPRRTCWWGEREDVEVDMVWAGDELLIVPKDPGPSREHVTPQQPWSRASRVGRDRVPTSHKARAQGMPHDSRLTAYFRSAINTPSSTLDRRILIHARVEYIYRVWMEQLIVIVCLCHTTRHIVVSEPSAPPPELISHKPALVALLGQQMTIQ